MTAILIAYLVGASAAGALVALLLACLDPNERADLVGALMPPRALRDSSRSTGAAPLP